MLKVLVAEFQKLGSTKGKKRTRVDAEYGNMLDAASSDGQGHTFAKLLRFVCKNLEGNFAADTNAFI